MPVTKVTLSAQFYEQSGQPFERVKLKAILYGVDVESQQYVAQDTQEVLSDFTGLAQLELFSNAAGTRFSYYRITATTPQGVVVSDSNVSIPANDCNLVDVEGNWSGEIFTGGASATVTGNLTVLGNTTLNSFTGQMVGGVITGITEFHLPQGTATAPIIEASAYWNSSTDTLTVGSGTVAKEVVIKDKTQTLTNKTFALGSNTLSGTLAQFNLACTDADFITTTELNTKVSKAGDSMTGALNINVTDNTNPALKVTQQGTGYALAVYDAVGDTTPFIVDSDGRLAIGGTPDTGTGIRIGRNPTAASAFGVRVNGTVQNSVSNSYGYRTDVAVADAAFTLASSRHFSASQGTKPAAATITSQYGFIAESSLSGAVNNYGFYGNVPAGANNYNVYAASTAENYLAGPTTINSGLTVNRDGVTAPAATDGNVFSGTYTPIVDAANRINVAAVTLNAAQYLRVGNTVTVSGVLSVQATAAGNVEFDLSLPVASNLTSFTQCSGSLSSHASVASASGAIFGDSARDVARVRVVPTTTTNISYSFNFTYRVL